MTSTSLQALALMNVIHTHLTIISVGLKICLLLLLTDIER